MAEERSANDNRARILSYRRTVVKVIINTYGTVNKDAGWNSQEVKLEKEKVTIEDALRSAGLEDERTLFDLVAEENRLKESYAIFLTGRLLWNPVDLKMEIKSGDQLDILDFPFVAGGG